MSEFSSNFAADFAKDCYEKQSSTIIASVRLHKLQGSECARTG